MKISYRDYPILEKLQKGKFGIMTTGILDAEYFYSVEWKDFYEIWKKNTKYFLKEINVLSEPFMEACGKVGNKLLEFYIEMINARKYDLSYNGTFIESKGYTHLLKYENKKETGINFVSLYWFGKDRLHGCYYCDDIESNTKLWMSDDYKRSFKIDTLAKEMQEVQSIVSRLIAYKLFKTYAEVETKELLPHTNIKGANCNYVNDTQLPITYLDSKWFTNLVKSDSFTVSGHFRLQPCGKELSQHKIIWINEYTKSGYTALARILSQNDT